MILPTYHHEGLPRVFLEAQALKTPVIAYESGGTSIALIHNKTGFIVKKGDIAELLKRTIQILDSKSLQLKMGLEGRKFVEEKFSLQMMVERHENFYKKMMSGL